MNLHTFCFPTLAGAQSSPIYKRSWFVAVVVVVCFLLIILLIALLVTRKRGERYPGWYFLRFVNDLHHCFETGPIRTAIVFKSETSSAKLNNFVSLYFD